MAQRIPGQVTRSGRTTAGFTPDTSPASRDLWPATAHRPTTAGPGPRADLVLVTDGTLSLRHVWRNGSQAR
ncbi:predicted protein [Streptomyces sp. AA4]|nr:predicted protein [Streptomyces sp. AA4]